MRNAGTKEALRSAAAAKLQGVGDTQGGQHFFLPESVAHRLIASRTLFVHHCCRVYRLHSLAVYRLHSLAVQMGITNDKESQWSFKHDKGILETKNAALESAVLSLNRKVSKLQASCRAKTAELHNFVRQRKRLGERANGRRKLCSILTSDQCEAIAADHALNRVSKLGSTQTSPTITARCC